MANASQAARDAGNTGPAVSRPSFQARIPPAQSEDGFLQLLSVVQDALSSSGAIDEFGFDPEFTTRLLMPLLRPLYRSWFRIDVEGVEHVPSSGAGLVVSNHAGAIAVDAVMTQVAIHDALPTPRYLRMLVADLVFNLPVLADVASRAGHVRASVHTAETLLSRGELVGVWPEGFKGIGKPFHKRYQLQRFGRGGFISVALRTGAPLIPTAVVGSEEIYPIIGDAKGLARLLDLPYFPITPFFPWLGPLGLIPLPSKWTIRFGEPIDTSKYGSKAADDPEVVFALADRMRDRIQQMLISMLLHRTDIFE
ncbi:MAG: lysophospholipid acyltransferase family protein [Actinomycetota bacterium]|nr:lysophospholipid acyltransferase family protein [Actinomycetota bacterium]